MPSVLWLAGVCLILPGLAIFAANAMVDIPGHNVEVTCLLFAVFGIAFLLADIGRRLK